jgi:hypothetical protein
MKPPWKRTIVPVPSKEVPTEVVTDAPLPISNLRVLRQIDAAPVEVAGTWDGARRWLAMAKRAQEVALACQVMVGFELIALRESVGETRGRGVHAETFEDIATREIGLGRRSVFKLMSMAEACVPRLRKHSVALKGFDPFSQPLAQLPEAQLHALSAAVHKITDGLTQTDFLVELGLAKAPQGSGATGGYRGRKPPTSVEEQAALRAQTAREDWIHIERCLSSAGTGFLLLEDLEVRAQMDVLEAHLRARKAWVSTTRDKRSPDDVEAILRTAHAPTLNPPRA